MKLRTILYIMDVDQPDGDCLSVVEACRTIDAHLSVLLVKAAPAMTATGYPMFVADGWVEQMNADMAELSARREAVTQLLVKENISVDVDDVYSEDMGMSATAGARARFADVTVMHRKAIQSNGVQWPALNGALFDSASPLLLLPDNEPLDFDPRTILLAWDGRIEAARTARAALPFLKRAQAVHVTLVDPEPQIGGHDLDPGSDIATYLARHKVPVAIDELPMIGLSVAQVLLQHARDIAADFIVMGAYGHSRLRERIFGGVTKTMLEEARQPLFVSH